MFCISPALLHSPCFSNYTDYSVYLSHKLTVYCIDWFRYLAFIPVWCSPDWHCHYCYAMFLVFPLLQFTPSFLSPFNKKIFGGAYLKPHFKYGSFCAWAVCIFLYLLLSVWASSHNPYKNMHYGQLDTRWYVWVWEYMVSACALNLTPGTRHHKWWMVEFYSCHFSLIIKTYLNYMPDVTFLLMGLKYCNSYNSHIHWIHYWVHVCHLLAAAFIHIQQCVFLATWWMRVEPKIFSLLGLLGIGLSHLLRETVLYLLNVLQPVARCICLLLGAKHIVYKGFFFLSLSLRTAAC